MGNKILYSQNYQDMLQSQNYQESGKILYEQEDELLQKIIFIQNRQIKNEDLGLNVIQIFRFKEPPYQYIMKHTKTFHQQFNEQKQYLNILTSLTKINHRNIAQIYYIKNWIQNSMCSRSFLVQNYSAYYGIQLREIIQQRKIKDHRFQQCQVYYILKSLLSIGSFLKKMKICFGLFQSKNIYISSEGYLKTYLYHILPNNKHFNYNHMYCEKPSNWSKFIPFSPQFISNFQLNISSSQNICPYKSDIFSIGMIIIQILMDNQLFRYYKIGCLKSLQFYHFKVKEDMKSLSNIYSEVLLTLIQKLIEPNPIKRWGFQEAQEYLSTNSEKFSKGSSLKMFDQDDQNKKNIPKVSYKSTFSKSQNILRSIEGSLQNKLTIVPIRSVIPDRKNVNLTNSSCKKTIYTRRNSHCGMQVVSKKKTYNKKTNCRNKSINTSTNSLLKNNYSINQQRNCKYSSYYQKCQNKITLTLGNTRISEDQRFTNQDYSNFIHKSQKLKLYQNYMSGQIQSSRTSITPIKQLKNVKNKANQQRKPITGINLNINQSKSRIVLR